MEQGLAMVVGMTIAYAASFLGMAFAYFGWKKRRGEDGGGDEGRRPSAGDGRSDGGAWFDGGGRPEGGGRSEGRGRSEGGAWFESRGRPEGDEHSGGGAR